MKILALDTSTMMTTCSVIDENKILGEFALNQDMTHSERLIPMIKEVLDNLNLKIKDIDLYGVSVGPGSFTGLRIGIGTIKSFAHLYNKPVVGVSTMEGLAYNLPYNKIIVPMIDARRDRVYTGIYTWEDGRLNTLMKPDAVEINELLKILDTSYEKVIVNGDGSLLYKELISKTLKDKVLFSTIGQNMCRSSSIGELALIKYRDGIVDDFYTIIPDYLRASQAERELIKKEQEK